MRPTGDRGSITLTVVFLAVVLLSMTGLVYDAGGALGDRQRAADLAEQAARIGADQLLPSQGDLPRIDPDRARTAATTYLAAAGVTGTVTATPATVTVTVSIQHPTALLALIGVTDIPVTGTATAVPLSGLAVVN